MAFLPCHACRVARPGRNQWWYLAYGLGSDMVRTKLRLCARHSLNVEKYLTKFELVVAEGADSISGARDTCIACGEPASELDWHVFGTTYPPKDERKDYYGKLHVDCRMPPEVWYGEPDNGHS